ncbi:MAG TPA: hypothetical protein VHD87_15475 [Acidimicrobiales bacterium]|nr:hypothetical protein [Acidimicrobiales bacterium]
MRRVFAWLLFATALVAGVVLMSSVARGLEAQHHRATHMAAPSTTTTTGTPVPLAPCTSHVARNASGAYVMPACAAKADPAVTQQNIGSTICVVGYTKTVRPPVSVTGRIKAAQRREPNAYTGEAELDHAISLELGGWHGADGANLWLEPQPRARAVDQLENQLHRDVCAGRISLEAAQAQLVKTKEDNG